MHWQTPQVVQRIEAVIAATPSSQAFIYGDFPELLPGVPAAPAASLEPPVLPLAVAATGAPISGPHQVPLPLNGTTNAPAISGEARHLVRTFVNFQMHIKGCLVSWSAK